MRKLFTNLPIAMQILDAIATEMNRTYIAYDPDIYGTFEMKIVPTKYRVSVVTMLDREVRA